MRFLFSFFVLLTLTAVADDRIAWYTSWEQGARVARESGRPIFLMAAAPQCHGISGVW